ncbi:hypothetical protein ALC56_01343 [Trachymyrmex septentrionalis]|uniref:Uncharacterized protein n=1 Tax=Trachymyrmex septentrionalis TaxID=34720 RepID=A0A151K0K6_9HYME|nr:hypothetical protein ALC56_01343 [Trachymyrmex septentrionalis]
MDRLNLAGIRGETNICESHAPFRSRNMGQRLERCGSHRDEVLVQDGVRSGVSRNIDCHQSISFVGRGGIESEKPIPVDRRGI